MVFWGSRLYARDAWTVDQFAHRSVFESMLARLVEFSFGSDVVRPDPGVAVPGLAGGFWIDLGRTATVSAPLWRVARIGSRATLSQAVLCVDAVCAARLDHRVLDRIFDCIWGSCELSVGAASWGHDRRDADVRPAALWDEESRSGVGRRSCVFWSLVEYCMAPSLTKRPDFRSFVNPQGLPNAYTKDREECSDP